MLYIKGCNPYCYTCFGNSSFNCLSCFKNQHLTQNNSCECNNGFFQKDRVCLGLILFMFLFFLIILNKKACHYSCKECTGPEASQCLLNECVGNHIYSGGLCTCPFWSEDLGKNINCSSKKFFIFSFYR